MSSNEYISQLVAELTKSKPDHLIVKTLCEKTGYAYSQDLIQLMSEILMSKNNFKMAPNNKKNKTQIQFGV